MSGEPIPLKTGREAYQRRRRRDAIKRVEDFRRWLAAGAPFSQIPDIPSKADYRAAREHRDRPP